MKTEEVNKLPSGVYIVHWKKKHGGGRSLAALGYTGMGERWLAPCNWIAFSLPTTEYTWKKIKKMQLVMSTKNLESI